MCQPAEGAVLDPKLAPLDFALPDPDSFASKSQSPIDYTGWTGSNSPLLDVPKSSIQNGLCQHNFVWLEGQAGCISLNQFGSKRCRVPRALLILRDTVCDN